MAKEFYVPYGTSGLTTLYVVPRRASDGAYRYSVTPAFEAFNASHVASYGIALTEEGTTGNYYASLPSDMNPVAVYPWVARVQSGGSAAWPTDTIVWEGVWDGPLIGFLLTGHVTAVTGANAFTVQLDTAYGGSTATLTAGDLRLSFTSGACFGHSNIITGGTLTTSTAAALAFANAFPVAPAVNDTVAIVSN